jgi:ribosomal protein S4E
MRVDEREIPVEVMDLFEITSATATCRVLPDGDERVEFAGFVEYEDVLYKEIFYQSKEDLREINELSDLDWVPDHYEAE